MSLARVDTAGNFTDYNNPLLLPSIKPSLISYEHHLLPVLVYSPMFKKRGSKKTLMAVGAVVVVVGLAHVVTPALMSIGGVIAGTGKLSPQVDQLVKYHLSPRELLGTMVGAKVAAAGSALAASILAAFAEKLWTRMARATGVDASGGAVAQIRRHTLP